MPKRNRNPEIYVKGFRRDTTKDDLRIIFRRFGRIIDIQYKGRYAFIEYEDYKDAQKAIRSMNDEEMDGIRLTVQSSGLKTSYQWQSKRRSRSSSARKESSSRKKSKRGSNRRSKSSSSSSSRSSHSSPSSSSSQSSSRSRSLKKKAIYKDKRYNTK